MVLTVESNHLSAGTAVASCGIAYAMRYVRAAVEGSVELGFKASDAQQIVCQTLKGAVELLLQNGNNAEVEIDKVTTPGGITIKGLNTMEKNGFTNAVIEGLKASV
jgi:pyrroline-5-carboxylate reductase